MAFLVCCTCNKLHTLQTSIPVLESTNMIYISNGHVVNMQMQSTEYYAVSKGQEISEYFFLSSIPPKQTENNSSISALVPKKWLNKSK